MHVELTKSQQKVIELLNPLIWLVGGAVRDLVIGVTPKDLDFCTVYSPSDARNIFRDAGFIVIPDEKAFDHGINRIVDKESGKIIDIATLRKDVSCDGRHAKIEFTQDILEDLARRDFTINAMAAAVDPDTGLIGSIMDPFGGQDDIANKEIRFVGDPQKRIDEDYLRMVRACRFTCLGDDWQCLGKLSILKNAKRVKMVSKERIRDELMKSLTYAKPSMFIKELHETGLLEYIFPTMNRAFECEQNVHHDYDLVSSHILRCLDASVELTDNVLLRLAALLHDIGKVDTKEVKPDGSVTFYKHEVVGANIATEWMTTYRFSNKEIAYVSKMIRYHQWRFEDDTKLKTIRKWLNDVGKSDWRDLITLRMADRKGNKHKQALGKSMMTSKMQELVSTVENLLHSKVPIFIEDLAIDGDDIKEAGVEPGPIYKEIFSNLMGIVFNDPKKNTKDWLGSYIRRNYGKEKENSTTSSDK